MFATRTPERCGWVWRTWLCLATLAWIAAACSTNSVTIDSPTSDSVSGAATPADEPTAEAVAPATVEPAPADEPAREDDSNDGDETQPQASDDPLSSATVMLLDPGAEPRIELRLDIAASCSEIMTMEQTQQIEQTLAGNELPSAGSVGTVMEMATSATRDGDNYEVRAEIISAEAAPGTPSDVALGLNAELAQLTGIVTYTTINDRAELIPGSSRVEGAEALGPLGALLESAAQVQNPLPIEAVGVGARWEVTSTLQLQGLTATTTSVFELVALDGNVIELAITAEQRVPTGEVMAVEGFEAAVTSWDVSSSGTSVLDLAAISPVSMTSITAGTQSFDFGAAGGELAQSLETQLSSTSRPGEGCTGVTTRP